MRRALRLLRRALLCGLVMALASCSSGPGTIGPTGVDQLAIPTPSPDPGDFVAEIDNPWLPLRTGASWTYLLDGAVPSRKLLVDAATGPFVAGVPTVAVTTTEATRRGRTLATSTAWYAQDSDGNVWLFGESGTQYAGGQAVPVGAWQAGKDGAEAGLAMPAIPRLGDGYRPGFAPGIAEDRVLVESVTEQVTTPLGVATDVVLTENTSALAPDVSLRWYAPDLGLVRLAESTGDSWTLTHHTPGQ
jgi:hypothetical protein